MTRLITIILSLIIVLLAAALIGPSFIDWNKYKPQIVEQVKAASGYTVAIEGDLSAGILPSPHVSFEKATILAPRAVNEQTLIAVEKASVSVQLFPLLDKRVVVESIELVSPDIRLEVSKQGTSSWIADSASKTVDAASEVAEKTVEEAQRQAGDAGVNAMKAISLDSVKISDGRLEYVNYQTGARQLVENLNVDLKAGSVFGPYDGGGDVVYNGKKITFTVDSGEYAAGEDMQLNAEIGLPDMGGQLTFAGVVGTQAPFNTQGEINLSIDKLQELAAVPPALQGKTALEGMITASETGAQVRDASFTLGGMDGSGSLDVTGLKEKNPVKVTGRFALEDGVNLDSLMGGDKAANDSKGASSGQGGPAKEGGSPVPQSLTLPFPLVADITLSAPEMTLSGQKLSGVQVSLAKEGKIIAASVKAADIPGNGTIDAKGTLTYGSSSISESGAVTYADPSLSYSVEGTAQQLPTLLRAAIPAQKDNPAFELFRSATFDLSGGLAGEKITLTDSRLTLDDTILALSGSYAPGGQGGKPDVVLDVSANMIDIDALQARLSGQKKQAVQSPVGGEGGQTDLKEALKPVQEFSLPVNLTFDISAQKARFNGMDASGLRLKGKSIGNTLQLDAASAQQIMGASVSAQGSIGDLSTLSGITLDVSGKTSDVKSLMQGLKMDASKVPQQITGAEATVSAKGSAETLNFTANISALQGKLDASGVARDLLGTMQFDDLTIGLNHPNFVQAMQIVNPEFSGGPGLQKRVTFYAKTMQDGKTYRLQDFKASLGETTAGGDLTFDTSGDKPSVNGSLVLGDLPLDSLLGAKKSGGSSGASGGGGSSASSGGERWSRNAFDFGFLHSANMNLDVSAKSITYGGWNLQNPKTKVTLKDGALSVPDLTASLFGGSAKLKADVNAPADQKQPVTIAVDSTMTDINLEPLAAALSGSNRIKASGRVSLAMNVNGSGISPNAMVSSLKGKANLDGADVVLKGFDLAQLTAALLDSGKPLDRLQNLVGGATRSGQTAFSNIDGDYTISEGVATIDKMVMTGEAATITSTGNVSLPRWYIDTVHMIDLAKAKEVEPFRVEIKGPLDNPANTFGSGLFDEMLRRRVQDKVIEKLPDLLGDDVTDKLGEFGIIPKKQQAAPAPVEAAPADPNAAPVEQAPAQQQQPEPTPEEMLKGVLGGLLKQ